MALSSEEKALLANIQSLTQQIMQIEEGGESTGGDEPPAEDAEMADTEITPENEEEEDNEDDEVVKSDEGTNASDDADSRLEDDLPEITEDGLAAIKSLVSHGVLTVNKSKSSKSVSTDVLAKAVTQLSTVVKSLVNDQHEISKAVYGIIDGMGITAEIKKSMKTADVSRSVKKSAQVADMSVIKQEIIDGVSQAFGVAPTSNIQIGSTGDVRKSLASVMSALVVQK